MRNNRGVSLVEILIGLVIVTIAAICALGFFSNGLGGIGRQGNRRAALEQARARMEQIMAANASVMPAENGNLYWLECTGGGNPCNWTKSNNKQIETNIETGNIMETTAQWIDDPATAAALDTVEYTVKVWFANGDADDYHHRVCLKTLRSP